MIEVYKNFEFVTKDPDFINFQWKRRFSRPGEFKLEMAFTPEKFLEFAEGNVIYKRDVDEACFIERREVLQTVENELILVVSGRSLSSLLDRRIMSAQGAYTLSNFLTTVINDTFINPSNTRRKMDNLRLLSVDVPIVNIKADFRMTNVLDNVCNSLESNNSGLKIDYNIDNKTFDLSFYKPTDTAVIFSREFSNIFQQDYVDDMQGAKTTAYVGDNYLFVYGDEKIGFSRRELHTSAPSADSGVNNTQAAINALNENRTIKSLSNVVDGYSEQFEYLKDWTIGSVVLAENELLNYSEHEIVVEIMEFYDGKSFNLEVTLGDYWR